MPLRSSLIRVHSACFHDNYRLKCIWIYAARGGSRISQRGFICIKVWGSLCWFYLIFYTLPHFSVGVLCYTLRCLSVCLSVRPSDRAHHFRSITWVFIHGFFSKFAYILLSAMSGMGLLMGKIRPFLTELLPFFVLEKWFLACYFFTSHDIWMKLHRYVAYQRLHIMTKDRHSDLPSLWVICPW